MIAMTLRQYHSECSARFRAVSKRLCASVVLLFCFVLSAFAEENSVKNQKNVTVHKNSSPKQLFSRAQDLGYGRVLFDYHQGQFLEALISLNIVNAQGGIAGHGDHPKLLEGGLLLSYGMIQSAKEVFEDLLTENNSAGLTIDERNRAWFYLGKVQFLQGSLRHGLDSFGRMDIDSFKVNQKDLYQEFLYLLSLMADEGIEIQSLDSLRSDIRTSSIWAQYTQYNEAARLAARSTTNSTTNSTTSSTNSSSTSASASDVDRALAMFDQLTRTLSVQVEPFLSTLIETDRAVGNDVLGYDPKVELANERLGLIEQCYLSMAQLYLKQGKSDVALGTLRRIRKDSFLSDQAYFTFAVASAELGQHALALEALTDLSERKLFTPWLQQVPYAMAYLYEQMNDKQLAVQAYASAVEHHEALDAHLFSEISSISEEKVVNALKLDSVLGHMDLRNDKYGRIEVEPEQFEYVYLLADDGFQGALSDLHELYKIQGNLSFWQQKLVSFDHMMDLRMTTRSAKITATKQELEIQQAGVWKAQAEIWRRKVDSAIAKDDGVFFLDESQKDHLDRIESVRKNLALLPEDHALRADFEARISRIENYFSWFVSDQMSVNQWRVLKQVRLLERELETFQVHQEKLNQEMASEELQLQFQYRIDNAKSDLDVIQANLEAGLNVVRNALLESVREEFKRQQRDNRIYLREARKSLARLADEVYRTDAVPDTVEAVVEETVEDVVEDVVVDTEEELQ